ncbi:MAG: hypothetical protein A3F10_06990 [Coxiella sp. RIFCSPHIGHO2_12_FULL_42_15]|nr:MAG: hypothetical protein A3F10_06990 [Coxiella sp. RIFCSPHIGHO2_12_FULL_42_15]
MGFVPITDEEQELLNQDDYILWPAYVAIKKYMDWESGISGVKRKISYQWLVEVLHRDAAPGKKKHTVTKSQARHLIFKLEKMGIVTRLSERFDSSIILKHNFHFQAKSVSGRFVRGLCEASARSDIRCDIPENENNVENTGDCRKAEVEVRTPLSEGDFGNALRCYIPLYNQYNKYQILNNNTSNLENLSELKKSNSLPEVEAIFSFWQTTLNHPGAKLDAKRKRVIENALKLGYSIDACKQAIRGCAHSAFHMGKNQEGKVYDHLSLILRDSERIEQFVALEKQSSMGQGEQRHANHHRTFVKTETPHQRVTRELGDQIREYEQKSGRSLWPPC